jgi:hypothetical protein
VKRGGKELAALVEDKCLLVCDEQEKWKLDEARATLGEEKFPAPFFHI